MAVEEEQTRPVPSAEDVWTRLWKGAFSNWSFALDNSSVSIVSPKWDSIFCCYRPKKLFNQSWLLLQMFDWIYSNREVFLANYVDIGRNHGIFWIFSWTPPYSLLVMLLLMFIALFIVYCISALPGTASKLQEEHGQFTVASNVSLPLTLNTSVIEYE